tara:strand:- start:237 stop:824 length:588 start_codon:yes stop_codon:yes gene_type:complete
MNNFFLKYLQNSVKIKINIINDEETILNLSTISDEIYRVILSKKKILTCGNGGSFSDASHFTTELMVRYSKEFDRKPISCLNLSNDGSLITAHTNDYNFETLFSRSVEGLGTKGDCLIIFSTSGNSKNIIKALIKAKEIGITTIGMLGNDGGKAKNLCDFTLVVKSNKTSHIQECHIVFIHALVESLENKLKSAR